MAGKHLDAMPPMTNVQPSAITSCDWKDNVQNIPCRRLQKTSHPTRRSKTSLSKLQNSHHFRMLQMFALLMFSVVDLSLWAFFFWLSSLYQYCKLARPSQFRCIFFSQSSVGLNFCGWHRGVKASATKTKEHYLITKMPAPFLLLVTTPCKAQYTNFAHILILVTKATQYWNWIVWYWGKSKCFHFY